MIIDCNILIEDFAGYLPSSLYMVEKLKAGKLVRELNEISESYQPKRNFMIMSMNIFNLLENHEKFEHLNLLGRKNEDFLYLVGRVCDIDCYIDLNMMENTIILSWDKQRSRELKLESLLNDNKVDMEHLKIDVII